MANKFCTDSPQSRLIPFQSIVLIRTFSNGLDLPLKVVSRWIHYSPTHLHSTYPPEDIQLIIDALLIREYISRYAAQVAEEHFELSEARQSYQTAHHCNKLIQRLEGRGKASICICLAFCLGCFLSCFASSIR